MAQALSQYGSRWAARALLRKRSLLVRLVYPKLWNSSQSENVFCIRLFSWENYFEKFTLALWIVAFVVWYQITSIRLLDVHSKKKKGTILRVHLCKQNKDLCSCRTNSSGKKGIKNKNDIVDQKMLNAIEEKKRRARGIRSAGSVGAACSTEPSSEDRPHCPGKTRGLGG